MLEQYLIYLIKNPKLENICLESDERKIKWFFSCYIGRAYSKESQEVWVEGNSPFEVLEQALVFIDKHERNLKVGDKKRSKWDNGDSEGNSEEESRNEGNFNVGLQTIQTNVRSIIKWNPERISFPTL